MIGKSLLLLGGAVLLTGAPAFASAQTRADLIPLGQSAASGAVCQAVRDYDDPLAQGAGRRASRAVPGTDKGWGSGIEPRSIRGA